MKSKIYKLALLFAVILTALVVFPNFDKDVSVVSANSEYEVSINPKYYNPGGYARTEDSGVASFVITLSKAYDEDVDVYYEAMQRYE